MSDTHSNSLSRCFQRPSNLFRGRLQIGLAGLLYVLSLSILSLAQAAPSANSLYEVAVRVDSQGGVNEENALKAALARVVVRLSGDREAVKPVRSLLGQAKSLVQSYRYQRDTGGEGPQLYLLANFDPPSLRAWMVKQQLPVWGGERPETLVWLAVNAGSSRVLVSAEQYPKLRASLESLAAQRGLPLLFPLMDLEDRNVISYADVWGRFSDAIEAASARYRAQSVLVGRLSKTPGGLWRVEWEHSLQGEIQDWQASGRQLTPLLRGGIDGATDRLAQLLAIQTASSGPARIGITVSGIHNVQDYARATRYLAGLGPVKHLQVSQVLPEQLRLVLDIDGSVGGLERLLSLGSILGRSQGAVAANDQAADSEPQLSYQLLP